VVDGVPLSKVDWKLFQLLVEYHLDPIDSLTEKLGATSTTKMRRMLNAFSEKYQLSICVEVLDWERVGLHPFIVIGDEPLDHPYVLSIYELLGSTQQYLSLCVTPSPHQIPLALSDVFNVTQIYPPINSGYYLHESAQDVFYTDEWLLRLKEIMFEDEMGDVVRPDFQRGEPEPIQVNPTFLKSLSRVFLNERLRNRSQYFNLDFIRTHKASGFLTTYLDFHMPELTDYLLILDDLVNPALFVGGFTLFPLAKLYETPNALICYFKGVEQDLSRFATIIFTHLREICQPALWVVSEKSYKFDLLDQWENGGWKPF